MKKEFEEKVKNLFDEMVTIRENDSNHTAAELLKTLNRKVTRPIKATVQNGVLSLVYDNVSLDIQSDLSAMRVWYTGDYTATLRDMQDCDPFQMSEFVLALERDMPFWKYIWVVDEKLRKEKARIQQQVRSALREIKLDFRNAPSAEDFDYDRHRIRFYNIKAKEMMVNNENPFWENKRTEAEILDECNLFHVVPPIECWYEEWTQTIEKCEKDKAEAERKREERIKNLMKMRHLINLKMIKLEALVRTIEFQPDVSVTFSKDFDENTSRANPHGHYILTLNIGCTSKDIMLDYNIVDKCIPKTIECLKRINDLVPELWESIRNDDPSYYLDVFRFFTFYDLRTEFPYYVIRSKDRSVIDDKLLASVQTVLQLNRMILELEGYIARCIATYNPTKGEF